VIEDVGEDDSILEQRFHFIPIDKIDVCVAGDAIDVMGVAINIDRLVPIVSRTSAKSLTKRVVTLLDDTLLAVDVTFWSEQAEKINESMAGQVIAVKACKVSEYGGRSLSTVFGTRIFINPDHVKSKALREWFDTKGRNATPDENISRRKVETGGGGADPRRFFGDIKDENLAALADIEKKGYYFVTRCTPIRFRNEGDKPPYYDACPSPKCNRKLTKNESTKLWYCENCKNDYPAPLPRYILSLHAADATGELWLTAFNEVAEHLLSTSAQTLSEYKSVGNDKDYERVFKRAVHKTYLFKCRAKKETREDKAAGTAESRIRYHVIGATPVSYKQEALLLLDQIQAYLS